MSNTNRLRFLLVIVMVISGIIGITLSILTQGSRLFETYTEDSNILNLATSIMYLLYLLKWLPQNEKYLRRIKVLRFISTSCVTLTFLVVLFILAPMAGGIQGFVVMFFSGSMFFNHFLTPILSIIVFVFFEDKPRLTNKSIQYALIPTIIYGVITLTMNAFGVLDGPYPFLRVRSQPVIMSIIWIVIIYLLNYFIARLLLYFNKKNSPSI